MRKAIAVLVAVSALLALASPATARRPWKRRIDRLATGHEISIAVYQHGRFLYEWRSAARRRPASNQKMLTAMALLDRLGPDFRMSTTAAVTRVRDGIVPGSLWIVGRGDPAVSVTGSFSRSLPFTPTRVRRLALRIRAAGVKAVRGRVMGGLGYFARDWDAPGWRSYYRSMYIARPTALTFNGNTHRGTHVADPERLLARKLTRALERLGVSVSHPGGAGHPPPGRHRIARVRSRPLSALLRFTSRTSSNFFAEVLGKRLAVARFGPPGTIARAGRTIARWASARGVRVAAHDASGLSHANRISARGLVRLLVQSGREPWGRAFRHGLPAPGQGTLGDRLGGVRLRAKTGTLIGASALSGWVRRPRSQGWATFSILSEGMPKYRASALEDRIVRILERSGGTRAPRLSAAAPLRRPLA
jgi:D-alanyl-D-alanine carboxypeptidase/D-alanyl-D-alanine-endopeptidase (penicillin-binding protein 4)